MGRESVSTSIETSSGAFTGRMPASSPSIFIGGGRVRDRVRGGFTLVEVVIALLVMTLGVLTLASTTLWVVHESELGDPTPEQAAAPRSIVDGLDARPQGDVAAATPAQGGHTISWSVSAGARPAAIELLRTGAGAPAAEADVPTGTGAVVDTLDHRGDGNE